MIVMDMPSVSTVAVHCNILQLVEYSNRSPPRQPLDYTDTIKDTS